MLLLMKVQRFEEALYETDQVINLCKKHGDYLRLAICYIRKGICMNRMDGTGEEWIMKGKGILTAIEKIDILKILEEEIMNIDKLE